MTTSTSRPSRLGGGGKGARADEILDVASRLFREMGYAATTITDIATAVGVLPGSLYHHFASKEDIALALLDNFAKELDSRGSTATRRYRAGDESAEHLLRSLTVDMCETGIRRAAAVRLRAYDAPPSVASDRLTAAMHQGSRSAENAWRLTIEQLSTEHGGLAVDPRLLRFTFERLTLDAPQHHSQDSDPAAVARGMCGLLLHGLATSAVDYQELETCAAYRTAEEFVAESRAMRARAANDPRSDILTAARTEFARRGYAATTIRDIARAADVGMATVYRRVDSKEALLREIVETYANRVDGAVNAVLNAGSSAAGTVVALARVLLHITREHRESYAIVNLGWTGRESEASPVHPYFVGTKRRLRGFENLIDRAIRGGEWRSEVSTQDLARHVRSVVWTPYHACGRTSERRANDFVRTVLLNGALRRN